MQHLADPQREARRAASGSSPATVGRWRAARLAGLLAVASLAFALAPLALAKDSVYWANSSGPPGAGISSANLDDTGGGDNLNTTGATDASPQGVAIDSAGGRIHWLNGTQTIASAKLDDTGDGADLTTTGASILSPFGLAIDPVAGKIYWGNTLGGPGLAGSISVANLDGSGGQTLYDGNSPSVTIDEPSGIAIDPASNRIYYSNSGDGASNGTISRANLDGTGNGAELYDSGTAGVTVSDPFGVAIDTATGKIYWASATSGPGAISMGNLDGSAGAVDIDTTGADLSRPTGVAIDPTANRIYWANTNGPSISFANLDGTGAGGDLNTSGAALDDPNYVALLKSPLGAGPPTITNGPSSGAAAALGGVEAPAVVAGVGEQRTCGDGTWAPDLLGSHLYRVPASFAYQWLRDGAEIAGATQKTLAPTENGSYSCRVSATNQAGSASQTSAPLAVISNKFSFGKLKLNKKKGTAKLTVKVPGAGKLKLKKTKKLKGAKKSPSKAGKTKLTVKPKGKAKKKLNQKGKAKVKAKVTYRPTGGSKRAKTKKVKLKQRG